MLRIQALEEKPHIARKRAGRFRQSIQVLIQLPDLARPFARAAPRVVRARVSYAALAQQLRQLHEDLTPLLQLRVEESLADIIACDVPVP